MRKGCRRWAFPAGCGGVVELYDAATDWIPIYDKSALPGFYMACGTSGNQYKNAPVAGRLDGGPDRTIARAGPITMSRRCACGWAISGTRSTQAFFSRRRAINAESSFSVLG